jgi:4-oxalocrotonate tautomerase
MPHVIVKLYPGRSQQQKAQLTEAIVKNVMEIAKCDESSVSVAFEEIPKEDWAEKVYRPDILEQERKLTKKPGYNPFEKEK